VTEKRWICSKLTSISAVSDLESRDRQTDGKIRDAHIASTEWLTTNDRSRHLASGASCAKSCCWRRGDVSCILRRRRHSGPEVDSEVAERHDVLRHANDVCDAASFLRQKTAIRCTAITAITLMTSLQAVVKIADIFSLLSHCCYKHNSHTSVWLPSLWTFQYRPNRFLFIFRLFLVYFRYTMELWSRMQIKLVTIQFRGTFCCTWNHLSLFFLLRRWSWTSQFSWFSLNAIIYRFFITQNNCTLLHNAVLFPLKQTVWQRHKI